MSSSFHHLRAEELPVLHWTQEQDGSGEWLKKEVDYEPLMTSDLPLVLWFLPLQALQSRLLGPIEGEKEGGKGEFVKLPSDEDGRQNLPWLLESPEKSHKAGTARYRSLHDTAT